MVAQPLMEDTAVFPENSDPEFQTVTPPAQRKSDQLVPAAALGRLAFLHSRDTCPMSEHTESRVPGAEGLHSTLIVCSWAGCVCV